MTPYLRTLLETELAQLKQSLAGNGDVDGARFDRFAKCDGDVLRNPARPFEEIPAAFKRENRSPKPVQPHRHNRCLGQSRHQLKPFAEFDQYASPAKFTFW